MNRSLDEQEKLAGPARAASRGPAPMGTASVLLAISTVILWGGTAVSNQFCTDVLPPIYLGGARFGLAALFMIGWCLVERAPLMLQRHQWRYAIFMGLLLFLQIYSFNVGTMRSNSSHSSVLVNSYIFWVAAFEALVQRTLVLRGRQLIGLLLSAGGCSLLLFATEPQNHPGSVDQPTLTGDLILLFSGWILAVKILYTKFAVQHVKPGPLILWHDILGAGVFFALSAAVGETSRGPMTPAAWIALLFSGLVVSGFCFGANAALLRKHGAAQVSVFSFATPLCGVALGVLLRGDVLTPWLIAAGVFVAAGIYLVNRAA